MNVPEESLSRVVSENSYPDYQGWWEMGPDFMRFMSTAIISQWRELPANSGSLETVRRFCDTYVATVYKRKARPGLVEAFVEGTFSPPARSGEFDALSYAFYRAAFEHIATHADAFTHAVAVERRQFTRRVGERFFGQLHDHLGLRLPSGLADEDAFTQLVASIDQIGGFLVNEGYLRDHFAFSFTLEATVGGRHVQQTDATFRQRLDTNKVAYAVYEMGYPAILPSAVYLYNTVGEAQHHSSRTIEELFARLGYEANETPDFDPTDYPADLVVELWEIRKRERKSAT